MIYLVKVSAARLSTNYKINGKILTEDKPIGVDDSMSNILWLKYFI